MQRSSTVRPESRSLGLRLLRGGLPAVAASGVSALVPLLGSIYVSTTEYAVWALGATLATVFIVFDFGSPSLATKLASTDQLTRAASRRLSLISLLPPLVLGVVASSVWPWYGSRSGLSHIPGADVVLLFAMISIGCALRSIGLVYAASALGSGRFVRRGVILVGGAAVNLIVTVICLTSSVGILSLGYGIVFAGLAQALLGILLEYRSLHPGKLDRSTSAEVDRLIMLFFRAKGLITLLGLGVTQIDRWAVGLIGNPALLAQYDIATRILVMPKVALVAIAAGLIAEGGRTKERAEAVAVLNRSESLLRIVIPILMTVAAGIAVAMQSQLEPAMNIWVLTALLAVAHSVNSMTIPSVFILTGLGRPDFELRYLVPLAGLTTVVYIVAIVSGGGSFFVYGWCLAMVGCSTYFLWKRKSYIYEAVS